MGERSWRVRRGGKAKEKECVILSAKAALILVIFYEAFPFSRSPTQPLSPPRVCHTRDSPPRMRNMKNAGWRRDGLHRAVAADWAAPRDRQRVRWLDTTVACGTSALARAKQRCFSRGGEINNKVGTRGLGSGDSRLVKILSGTPMMIGLSLQPTKNARFCLQHRRRR